MLHLLSSTDISSCLVAVPLPSTSNCLKAAISSSCVYGCAMIGNYQLIVCSGIVEIVEMLASTSGTCDQSREGTCFEAAANVRLFYFCVFIFLQVRGLLQVHTVVPVISSKRQLV